MANETIITKPFIKEVGDSVSGIFNKVLDYLASQIGVELITFQEKLIAMIVLSAILWLILSIAKKLNKVIFIVLIVVLGFSIFSTFASMF